MFGKFEPSKSCQDIFQDDNKDIYKNLLALIRPDYQDSKNNNAKSGQQVF